MLSSTRPRRFGKTATLPRLLACQLLLIGIPAQAIADPIPLKVEFLPSVITAATITSPDQKFLVSVYIGSSQLTKAILLDNDIRTDLDFAGEDKVTRLCFFKNSRPNSVDAELWAKQFDFKAGEKMRAATLSGNVECQIDEWVTQIGEKVLPLGLITAIFQKEIPCAGTPLIDSAGRIVGLILQPASANSAYIIPAQAVHRVQQDVISHHKLVRGWIGIALSTGSQIPRITRILPDSPAEKAGIMVNDILLSAGRYQTKRYPDAVNALFYTIPGQPTAFEILRQNKRLSIRITPTTKGSGD